jgi:hypothetical protein
MVCPCMTTMKDVVQILQFGPLIAKNGSKTERVIPRDINVAASGQRAACILHRLRVHLLVDPLPEHFPTKEEINSTGLFDSNHFHSRSELSNSKTLLPSW